MEILEFNGEGIKFQYLSNWREQNKDAFGPNCILSLVRVLEGNPSTITVSKNDADSQSQWQSCFIYCSRC